MIKILVADKLSKVGLDWLAAQNDVETAVHAGLTPEALAEIIGEAIQFAGPDRIVWGTDFYGPGGLFREATIGLRTFEMPEDLQKGYGFAPVTEEVKRKIFGENLAKLLGIDPTKRRVKI